MKSVCQGLDDLVYTCSYNILNKCFNRDTIHQINNGLLENMKHSLDTLKDKTGFDSNFCSIFENSFFENDQTDAFFHFNENGNNDVIGSFEKFTDGSNNI